MAFSFKNLRKDAPSVTGSNDVKKTETTVAVGRRFKAGAKLVETRFCYGCENFAVDAPETKNEIGWCGRDRGGENFHWLPITKNTQVRSCPKVKSGEVKIIN